VIKRENSFDFDDLFKTNTKKSNEDTNEKGKNVGLCDEASV
jgi:hypothetical protein